MAKWDHRKWGTEADPIRQSDLNNISSQNGCATRWFLDKRDAAEGIEREESTAWKRLLGHAVHETIRRALAREAMCAAVFAGKLPSTDRVLAIVNEEMEREAQGRPIAWGDAVPGTERTAAVHMVLGALRTLSEYAVAVVAVEAPFRVMLDEYVLEGTFDLVYRRRSDFGVGLADWKTGARKLPQVVLDHGYQTAIYSHALAEGVLWPGDPRELRVNTFPAEIHVVHLRDLVPYVKGPKSKVGTLRGKAWYPSRRSPDDIARLRVSLKKVVGTVRMGRALEAIGEQCGRCHHRGECLGAGHGPSADEAKQVELALAGTDLFDVLDDVA